MQKITKYYDKPLESSDIEQIYKKLILNIKKYHPIPKFEIIEAAYLLAKDAHKNQFRKSGENYFTHPLHVAVILSELELDQKTIIAGILHDVIEDTNYTYEDIKEHFGEEVADLVDGVTKLTKMQKFNSKEEEQAENYRKMFLAMAKDIRVIIIKIADRLHNLRTLQYMPSHKQKLKAQEALDIYAPISRRLGISKMHYELEDLSLMYIHPEIYNEIETKILEKEAEFEDFLNQVYEEIKDKCSANDIECTLEGRQKHYYSIYRKMENKNLKLNQVQDIYALRVITNEIHECYKVLGVLHEQYTPLQGRFKDYIGMPKANNYQSLHTTLMHKKGEVFEVQIRTYEMHKTSEYGIAAHWKYKQKNNEIDSEEEKLAWLRQILEWQRDMEDNLEYLETLKFDLNVYKDLVFCFTPKGQVVKLISGATPLDFAYSIHSAIGNKTVGAKINGVIVPFDTELKTGDKVEILTSQNSSGPKLDWLNIVKTSQARHKINQWFKKETKDESIVVGKASLEKEIKKRGLAYSELIQEEFVTPTLKKFNYTDFNSLLASIGHGGLRETVVVNKLFSEYKKINFKEEIVIDQSIKKYKDAKGGIIVQGVGDIDVRFSKCCSPLPGDEIIGFVTRGRGVSIHRTDCINVINFSSEDTRRIIEAEWASTAESNTRQFHVELFIIGEDRVGLVYDITKIFADEKISVKSMNIRVDDKKTYHTIGIEVSGKNQLDSICNKIIKLDGINKIERANN